MTWIHRKSMAEFIGTYFLLFAGAGAILIDHLTNSIWLYPVVTTLGVCIG